MHTIKIIAQKLPLYRW